MKLFYRKIGRGSQLFILHGLFGLSDNWSTVGKILAEDCESYLVDLRNHGKSPHSSEWTYPVMVDDVLELINNEGLNKVSLLGHSLGGKVAMQFASTYPERVEHLIVVDMAPKEYSVKSFDFIKKLLDINLREMKSRKEVELELRKFIHNEAILQLLLKNVEWHESGSSLQWKLNLKVIVDAHHKIGKTFAIKENINIPTLFIRGEKSDYISDSDVPMIKKYFFHSEIRTITGAGHWVHADKPMEFTHEVRRFING